jgi:hypothetical protein
MPKKKEKRKEKKEKLWWLTMIILQNCKQVDKTKEKKNVYMLCLVYAKTDEIQ